jgi:hypothetical protein
MRIRGVELRVVVLAIGLVITAASAWGQSTLYVDDDAPPGGDGTTWSSAHKYLQDALTAAAASHGAITEIHVAKGTYRPDQGDGNTSGDRTAAFRLISGVALRGGYAGLGAFDSDTRDIAANETVLSGDLAANDRPNSVNNGENAYHVVTGSDVDASAILDGFTITAGNANGNNDQARGGGAFINHGSPTLIDCIFRSNLASVGGGMTIVHCSPSLVRCSFLNNSAADGAGIYDDQANPTLANCRFQANVAGSYGAGVYNRNDSIPVLIDCCFERNGGSAFAGAVYSDYASGFNGVHLTNCIFRRNQGRAVYNGAVTMAGCLVVGNSQGGVYCGRPSSIVNCTIAYNVGSSNAYGVALGAGVTATITNTILWGNYASSAEDKQLSLASTATASVNDCCIQGWTGRYGGAGNTGQNPRFIDADGADNVYGTPDDDFRLGAGSPCIDMGDNSALPADISDLDGDGDRAEPLPFDVAGGPRVIDVPFTPDLVREPRAVVDVGALEASAPSPSRVVGVVYVDRSAQGADDGTTWANAFTSLHAALAAVKALNKDVVEIWVAAGTYKPAGPGGDRTASFLLPNKAELYGGFGGLQSTACPGGETRRGQRNPARNVTTLSGDLDGDDGPDFANVRDNSYTVLRLTGAGSSVLIDGFNIVGASTDGNGGGLAVTEAGELTVSNCTFQWNDANAGAAIYCHTDARLLLTVRNCVFFANQVGNASDPHYEGVVHYRAGSGFARVINSVFVQNEDAGFSASDLPATVPVELVNCTFADVAYGVSLRNSQDVRMANCVVWDSGVLLDHGGLTVDHCDIQQGKSGVYRNEGALTWGEGNIEADPKFVRFGREDRYSPGRWNLRLSPDSPCIDAGRNSAVPAPCRWDADDNPRFVDDARVTDAGLGQPPIVDIGAYESPNLILLVSSTEVLVPRGGTATLEVTLDRDPGRPVEVSIVKLSGEADLRLGSPATLSFDSADYSLPQTVVLAAGEDQDQAEGPAVFRLSAPGPAFADVSAWKVESDTRSPVRVRKSTGDSDDQ